MNIPDGGAARVGVALLAVGYPTCVVVLVRLLPVYRRRQRVWFGVLVGGLSCLVAGWLLLGRPGAAALNAAGLVAAAGAWVWRGRRVR